MYVREASEPRCELIVEPDDRLAEMAVYDGNLNVVVKSVGRLQTQLPRGIYRVRIRVGSATDEQLVALDQDRKVTFGPLPFATPVPLRVSEKGRQPHAAAAVAATGLTPERALGRGASIMVFAREWSIEGHLSAAGSAMANPMQGLSLLDAQEKTLADIAAEAHLVTTGDASAAWRADVAPGGYFLRLQFDDPDNTALLRPIHVSAGYQLQVFCLAADHVVEDDGQRQTMRRADLMNAAVYLSKSATFDPDDLDLRTSELACSALAQARDVLSPAVIADLTAPNFDNPTLGLLAAHLILATRPDDGALFRKLTNALLPMLGENHPDLRALWWSRGDTEKLGDGRLHGMPMLRTSWNLAVNRSLKTFDVLSLGDFARKLTRITPSVPWIILMDNEWAASDAAIDDYIRTRALAKQRVSRAEAQAALQRRSAFARSLSNIRNFATGRLPSILSGLPSLPSLGTILSNLPSGLDRLGGTIKTMRTDTIVKHDAPEIGDSAPQPVQPADVSVTPLHDDEKADLARTLGIPLNTLNDVLKTRKLL